MARRLELWFDFSCPYAYLAFSRVEALAERTGAELVLCPMLLGGVFRARSVPQHLFASHGPAKSRFQADDLRRLAQLAEVPLSMPAGHPFRTVDALRALLAAGEPYGPLAHRFYRAYWVENRDLGDHEVLRAILTEAGLDAEAVLEEAKSEAIKAELRRRTDLAVERGVFGAPTFFVDGELYFGQDRMDLVELALGGSARDASRAGRRRFAPVDFYFDYSSPFAYLASQRVEVVLGEAARWRPMLLGGLFREVGMVDVPYFAQSEAKQRHTARDLVRQAARRKTPFAWPSRFPMNSVLPLRVTLAARATESPEGRELIRRIFRAYWAEDRDISDAEVVSAICDDVGFEGRSLVQAAQAPEIKAALREATSGAAAAGVFGAPTFVVHAPEAGPRLYWGADRLDMAVMAANGFAAAL